MSRLGIRARFALLTAGLVLVIAALVGAGGYLSLRQSLLARAERQAADQARHLVGLVDVGRGGEGGGGGNRVDLGDPSLTGGFTSGGVLVSIVRPDGARIQSSRTPPPPSPAALRRGCLTAGGARARMAEPPVALACARVGPAARPAALVTVGVRTGDTRQALSRLAQALGLGVAAGALLAAVLARAVAQRALRPARQIARAAGSIRAGDLSRRIDYRGPRDELGELAGILDASFAELEQAAERQRMFVAEASHELRTPLATIQAHAELLQGWAGADPAARASALAALSQASRSANRLVADLLYLAQLDRLPPQPLAPAQLDQVVVEAARETQPLRPEVPIRIARLDEAQLAGDELALRQLVINVLANALRVSPAGAEVAVELAADERHASVSVSDRGPGVPPDQLERIFERFYTTTARGSRSSGLGLAIAREIARRHGGDVHAANRPGGGAAFRVELPLS